MDVHDLLSRQMINLIEWIHVNKPIADFVKQYKDETVSIKNGIKLIELQKSKFLAICDHIEYIYQEGTYDEIDEAQLHEVLGEITEFQPGVLPDGDDWRTMEFPSLIRMLKANKAEILELQNEGILSEEILLIRKKSEFESVLPTYVESSRQLKNQKKVLIESLNSYCSDLYGVVKIYDDSACESKESGSPSNSTDDDDGYGQDGNHGNGQDDNHGNGQDDNHGNDQGGNHGNGQDGNGQDDDDDGYGQDGNHGNGQDGNGQDDDDDGYGQDSDGQDSDGQDGNGDDGEDGDDGDDEDEDVQ